MSDQYRDEPIAILYNDDYAASLAGARAYEANSEIGAIAEMVAAILRENGWHPIMLPLQDSLEGLEPFLRSHKIAAVFNLVESLGGDAGREAEVPLALDDLAVPYTGNGAAALRVAHAKDWAYRALAAQNLPVPKNWVYQRQGVAQACTFLGTVGLQYPLFVKPAHADASIGIDAESVVLHAQALASKLEQLEALVEGPLLIEEYLPGREVNVAIFPDAHSGQTVCTEIDFSNCPQGQAAIVTYDAKWRPETPDYQLRSVPARGRWSEACLEQAGALARQAFQVLGATSYGRVDLRTDATGKFHIIDVNPNADIHPEAGLAIAAASVGIGYPALIIDLMRGAGLKSRKCGCG